MESKVKALLEAHEVLVQKRINVERELEGSVDEYGLGEYNLGYVDGLKVARNEIEDMVIDCVED